MSQRRQLPTLGGPFSCCETVPGPRTKILRPPLHDQRRCSRSMESSREAERCWMASKREATTPVRPERSATILFLSRSHSTDPCVSYLTSHMRDRMGSRSRDIARFTWVLCSLFRTLVRSKVRAFFNFISNAEFSLSLSVPRAVSCKSYAWACSTNHGHTSSAVGSDLGIVLCEIWDRGLHLGTNDASSRPGSLQLEGSS